jgi:hypothetical protein
LGLVETQQALVANGLRHKIRVQVDGGLKTGVDIVKAAILGAESFGFGTAPMMALGCKYLRICHLNNCATGVATQDEKLRNDHYHGLPERVTNYFQFIARETREIMAQLGVSQLVDLIGRTDFLTELDGISAKQNSSWTCRRCWASDRIRARRCICTESSNPPFDQGLMNNGSAGTGGTASLKRKAAKPSTSISATPTVQSARGSCPEPSLPCTVTRAWRRRSLSASRVPRARASACGTPAACTCT